MTEADQIKAIHAAALAASIPPNMRWIDAEAAAAMLAVSPSHFLQRIACKESFPKALRLDGGRPRWKAVEVAEWIERERAASPDRRSAA